MSTSENSEWLRKEGKMRHNPCAQEEDWCNHMNAAADEIERLRTGIQNMLDGNYTTPRTYRENNPETSWCYSSCPHGTYYTDECGQCNDEYLEWLLK